MIAIGGKLQPQFEFHDDDLHYVEFRDRQTGEMLMSDMLCRIFPRFSDPVCVRARILPGKAESLRVESIYPVNV